jgi:hypothetical protein
MRITSGLVTWKVSLINITGFSMLMTEMATKALDLLKHRLPPMFTIRHNVQAGGLMSYLPHLLHLTLHAGSHIADSERDNPPDLPVEHAPPSMRSRTSGRPAPRGTGIHQATSLQRQGARPWRGRSLPAANNAMPVISFLNSGSASLEAALAGPGTSKAET